MLLEIIGERTPFVLLGDFNDWFWPGSVRRVLARVLPDRSRHRTFPSACPILRLDRIYCRPRGLLVQSWTDSEARHISDHLPCIGDVLLREEGMEPLIAERLCAPDRGPLKTENPAHWPGFPSDARHREYIRPATHRNLNDYCKQLLTNCDCLTTHESDRGSAGHESVRRNFRLDLDHYASMTATIR